MTQWFAYGEDPRTFWALRDKLDVVLSQLDDKSDPAGATVFYRPSFGRKASYDRDKPRAEFGEFDAIVATSKFIYPIEAKLHASQEVDGTRVTLGRAQVVRHRVFAWYLSRYVESTVPWDRFVARYDSEFRDVFPGKKLAPPKSRLAYNIEFILQKLILFNSTTKDVLLYLHPKGSAPATSVDPETFSSVSVSFNPESRHGFFRL